MAMDWLIIVVLAVEIVNICLLFGLLSIYWGSYKKIKSEFTIGLIFFASVFLIKSIIFVIAAIFFVTVGAHDFSGSSEGGGMPGGLFLVNIIECVALAILLKITWK